MELHAEQQRRLVWIWMATVTLLVEGITLFLRFGQGRTAVQFNRTAPLLLQIHHMFWSVPVFLMALLWWRLPRLRCALLGIGWGLIVSDLAHHFLILPLTVGHTGWHWP